MRYFITIVLLAVLQLSGCGYKEGISTSRQVSFLYFSGNTDNVSASIDNGEQFSVEPGRDNQYEVRPGKHNILVYREGLIVVEREVYLGDGVAKEIGVN
jgi:hypothetical protein